MSDFSYLSNAHPDYIENLYNDYLKDKNSIDPEFRKFFEGFEFATQNYSADNLSSGSISSDEIKVFQLIEAYRNNGHLVANTNPIRKRKDRHANLDLSNFGLTDKDLKKEFLAGELIGIGKATLEKIIEQLQKIYCRTIGFQYNYVRETEEIKWLRQKIEKDYLSYDFPLDKKIDIFRNLNKAVVFEEFLGKKFIGEKRFSLEGGETTIPALIAIINKAATTDTPVEEVVIGMAHRGRLNVLTNILGKTYDEIFDEFEGNEPQKTMGDGDVKYHLGFRSTHKTPDNKEIHLELMPNPSHLEAVDPVVEGFSRAKADDIYNSEYDRILPLLIHGDAAVAGQGIVYETLQMSLLKGYYTGGSIHFVINNQIGFTTDFDDARSSDYCSSIAKTVNAPILQVNGDDIEAVIYVAEMAAEYRQKFNKDIFVDMVCYRKHGHNEADDPKYTQPLLYDLINKHKNPRDIYFEKLSNHKDVSKELAKQLDQEFWDELQSRLDRVKEKKAEYKPQAPELAWQKLRASTYKDFQSSPKTSITKANATKIIKALISYPKGFHPLRKVQKYLENRREVMQENNSVDWAAAELMAYGSILMEGNDVRMSGQDVKRGTFSHRHAVISDEKTGEEYNRLSEIQDKQGRFFIYNSHLSEYAVLGFEYGYSLASPNSLVIWEAQFGDFSNTAQAMIDQFIIAGESKWNRYSGLVMLLPHGYEGQGPEHSSARLERFLQMAAENNVVITNITDSANLFHAIRRQQKWDFRKPLINMSPKSLLRHPRTASPIDDLFKGTFKEILDDPHVTDKNVSKVKRLLLCSGKVSFDLLEKKENENRDDVAIVRLEQLYPINEMYLERILDKYKKAEVVWVQEEPENMGAWSYLLSRYYKKYPMECVARKCSASPATGYKKQHKQEQEDLLNRAFNGKQK
ncbi:MAG: 2-oxoglutarate dehydrogenase E1 component [Chitinophagales bacterium]|nr:2-oxoglutarate dehydrogenase E1 component [Chitinophagales bacterium]